MTEVGGRPSSGTGPGDWPERGPHPLQSVLDRIPVEWGKWIRCDDGWYPLIADLDRELAQVAPDYVVHQCKEKFGQLRFYFTLPEVTYPCCEAMEATCPVPGPIDPRLMEPGDPARTVEQQYELSEWWYETYKPHFDSPEHVETWERFADRRAARSDLLKRMHPIVRVFEARSAVTCEVCGSEGEGSLCRQNRPYGCLKTLCPTCAGAANYVEFKGFDSPPPK